MVLARLLDVGVSNYCRSNFCIKSNTANTTKKTKIFTKLADKALILS